MNVDGELCVQVNVICPNCKYSFDLCEDEHLTDEGQIYEAALTDNGLYGGFGHTSWGEEIECPNCEQELTVNQIHW